MAASLRKPQSSNQEGWCMMQRPRVFITGARRGIGQGIAFGFAQAGYDVVINDLVAESEAQQALTGLRERGAKAAYLQGNIADVSALPALAEKAFDAFGGLDCLVN